MRRILIENDDVKPKNCSYWLPWTHDSTCFNFLMPDELVHASDINSIGDKTDVTTLVIGCDLEDYGFISDMTNLQQLYIYSGNNIENVAFCENLLKLRQLYIVGSHIKSIDSLVKLVEKKKIIFTEETDTMKRFLYQVEGICIETDCQYLNGKDLLIPGLYVSEVIINKKRFRH